MSNLDFSDLKDPGEVGAGIMQGFKSGQEWGRSAALEKAVSDYNSDPNNLQALNTIMQLNPDLGMRLQQHKAGLEDRERGQKFNALTADYVTNAYAQGAPPAGSNFNALIEPVVSPHGFPGPGAASGQPQAMTPRVGPANGPGMVAPGMAAPAHAEQGSEMDLSFLGAPQDDADATFLEMLRTDPMEAIKVESTMRERFLSQLDEEREIYGWAIQRFAGIDNPKDYQFARRELAQRLGPTGQQTLAQVPTTFPGVEGLNALRLRALDAKDQIEHFQRQANIDADNFRSDRNTDDLISDRAARRDETRRYHDLTDETRRRGQDLGQSRAASRSYGSPRASASRPTATGPGGERVEWDGKGWVPIQ